MSVLLFSCDILNEHDTVVHWQLKWNLSGWQQPTCLRKNLSCWHTCYFPLSMNLHSWLSLSLSVCLFLSPAVQNEQRQHMCRYFQPPKERLLRSRHAFTWPNIHVQISSAIRACQYTTCFTLVAQQCCTCNSKPRVYHKTQIEGVVFGFCWLLPWLIYVQCIEKHVCHQQMYKLW